MSKYFILWWNSVKIHSIDVLNTNKFHFIYCRISQFDKAQLYYNAYGPYDTATWDAMRLIVIIVSFIEFESVRWFMLKCGAHCCFHQSASDITCLFIISAERISHCLFRRSHMDSRFHWNFIYFSSESCAGDWFMCIYKIWTANRK